MQHQTRLTPGPRRARFVSALAVAAGLSAVPAFAQVAVTPSNDAAALANAFASSQVTIVGTPTLQGGTGQQGTFTSAQPATIGFTSGVVLTTGSVNNVPGPNTGDTGTTQGGAAQTDPSLATLTNGASVNDANVLQFNFSVAANTTVLNFQYVFSSEEYNDFVGSNFNDVFGFFVDGKNVALIPGTSTPVSINNVNGGKAGTTPIAASNPQYFITNDPNTATTDGTTPDPTRVSLFQPDGLTTVLTANVLAALDPNLTVHTIKLAVGDVSDSALDSQVFLRSDSFGTPEPSTAMLALVAAGGLIRRRRA